jgi:hypothetical protein
MDFVVDCAPDFKPKSDPVLPSKNSPSPIH